MNARQGQMVCAGVAQPAKQQSQYAPTVFFTKSKLTLQQWFILIVWWAREYPVSAVRSEAEVTEVTSCQVYE